MGEEDKDVGKKDDGDFKRDDENFSKPDVAASLARATEEFPMLTPIQSPAQSKADGGRWRRNREFEESRSRKQCDGGRKQ